MSMDHWDEIRTAYQVARMGTVSGAAEALGVHHATVIRHIDALEARLGAKLFQRHARGYTADRGGAGPAERGGPDRRSVHPAGRPHQGPGRRGDGRVDRDLARGRCRRCWCRRSRTFRSAHPDLRVRLITDERLFRLEYGEAHVAIRAGQAARSARQHRAALLHAALRLVASKDYVDALRRRWNRRHSPITASSARPRTRRARRSSAG